MSTQRTQVDRAGSTVASTVANLTPEVRHSAKMGFINDHINGETRLHLLGLPAEIRTRIYGYATVEEEPIHVHAGQTQPPALLQVSRQIRKEASSIYYQDNRFRLMTIDYDGAAFAPFFAIVKGHKCKITQGWVSRRPSWTNLLRWMKAAHDDKIWSIEANVAEMKRGNPLLPNDYLAAAAIMNAQFKAMTSMEWGQVQGIIKAMRPLLVMLDARWEIDE